VSAGRLGERLAGVRVTGQRVLDPRAGHDLVAVMGAAAARQFPEAGGVAQRCRQPAVVEDAACAVHPAVHVVLGEP